MRCDLLFDDEWGPRELVVSGISDVVSYSYGCWGLAGNLLMLSVAWSCTTAESWWEVL